MNDPKSVISKAGMLRGAAIFLLTVVPIEELQEELVDVASRLRAKTIGQNTALKEIQDSTSKTKIVEDWCDQNIEINRDMAKKRD